MPRTEGYGRIAAAPTQEDAMLNARLALTVVRSALTLVALVWIAAFFNQHREKLVLALTEIDPGALGSAMLWVLVGLLPGALAWQRLLARELPGVPAARGVLVYLRSGIGKYTPGGVLAFAIQHRLLRAENAGSILLLRVFVGTALAACLAAALIGLPAVSALFGINVWVLGVPAVLATVAGLGLACRMRRWPVVPRSLERIGVPAPVPFAATVAIMAGAWTLTGLHLAALGLHTGAGAVFLVSAYSFSAIAGIVFAVLPGAVGIRDGALLAILSLQLAPADALMLALLSRALIIAGDVIGTGAAALALGRRINVHT
ncbi:hypothetical protein WNZ15_14345 [Roseibium sp. AS2]